MDDSGLVTRELITDNTTQCTTLDRRSLVDDFDELPLIDYSRRRGGKKSRPPRPDRAWTEKIAALPTHAQDEPLNWIIRKLDSVG